LMLKHRRNKRIKNFKKKLEKEKSDYLEKFQKENG